MIHELRTYTLQPGTQAKYLQLSGEVGRKIRGDQSGKQEGYWFTEFGTLNQVVHLWSFDDLNERDAAARRSSPRTRRGTRRTCPRSGGCCWRQEIKIHLAGAAAESHARRRAWRVRAALVPLATWGGQGVARQLQGGDADAGEATCTAVGLWQTEHRPAQRGRAPVGVPRSQGACGRPRTARPRIRPGRTSSGSPSVPGPHAGHRPHARADSPRCASPWPTPKRDKVIELGYGGSERLTMNMGPQHPSAHGVFRAILTLEGETVVAVDAVIGYLHRCHEKLAETLTYTQYPSIASKTDYVAAMTSELAYVRAAEHRSAKIEVPEARPVPARARGRAAAHRLALPVARHLVPGHGRGARRRRHRLPLLHPRARARARPVRVAGGRAAPLRLPPGRAARATTCPRAGPRRAAKTVDLIERRIDEWEEMLEGNAFFLARTQGVGVISRELAQEVGISGPLIRGSGVAYDIRRAEPYSSYEDFDFKVPVETAGDCFARYRVRMAGVPRVDQDRPPGAGRPARGARSRRAPA